MMSFGVWGEWYFVFFDSGRNSLLCFQRVKYGECYGTTEGVCFFFLLCFSSPLLSTEGVDKLVHSYLGYVDQYALFW